MNLDRLIELGFDRSYDAGKGFNHVGCSQCSALSINGTPCHESGCPNTKQECRGCDAIVGRGVRYCEDCA